MPPLKQPALLRDLTMDYLVEFCWTCCDKRSTGGCVDKLRQRIAVIKEEIGPHIPCELNVEFINRFVRKFWNSPEGVRAYPDDYLRIVTEIVMDRKIHGLKCRFRFLPLNPNDAHRIQGLSELHLSFRVSYRLVTFNLENLTFLSYTDNCTDDDLIVVGENCPKLRNVMVSCSKNVTDKGLLALTPCSDLNTVRVSRCSISLNGIHDFLSGCKKVQRLAAWSDSDEVGFDCFDDTDFSVYPSIEYFTIKLNRISNENLRTVVAKFPNLTKIGIRGYVDGDITILKSLNKLSELDIHWSRGLTWHDLSLVLGHVGGNLTRLWLYSMGVGTVKQTDLNFLFKFCSNLEYLHIEYWMNREAERLAIPLFQKLKTLICVNIGYGTSAALEFGQMSRLSSLSVYDNDITVEAMESLCFDKTKYPSLKSISLQAFPTSCDIDRIKQTIKENNLDLQLYYWPSSLI